MHEDIEESRIVSGFSKENENLLETNLRPKVLEEYIGQSKVKEKMRIFIEAAKARGEALDHVCSMARRAWERRRFPILSPTK